MLILLLLKTFIVIVYMPILSLAQVCAAKRKQLQFYTITESKVTHQGDISLPEPPVTMVCSIDMLHELESQSLHLQAACSS